MYIEYLTWYLFCITVVRMILPCTYQQHLSMTRAAARMFRHCGREIIVVDDDDDFDFSLSTTHHDHEGADGDPHDNGLVVVQPLLGLPEAPHPERLQPLQLIDRGLLRALVHVRGALAA